MHDLTSLKLTVTWFVGTGLSLLDILIITFYTYCQLKKFYDSFEQNVISLILKIK